MLTILKNTEQGLQTIDRLANGSWVKTTDPTPAEIAMLVEWGVDVDLVTNSLDMDEMALKFSEGLTSLPIADVKRLFDLWQRVRDWEDEK